MPDRTPENPNGAGRPTVYTPALGSQIVMALKNGATRRDAAALNGISYHTLWRWLAQGREEPDGEFGNFVILVEQAEAELMTLIAQTVIKAALTDPKLGLEVLKRRRRAEWGDSIDIGKLSTEQLLELYDVIPGGDSEGAEEA